jgi:hypothetical protein
MSAPVLNRSAESNPTSKGPTPPPGICGPNVTVQVESIWKKIQDDFSTWSPAEKEAACKKILFPVKRPESIWKPGEDVKQFVRGMADINGWDVLPLYQGESLWLRSYPVYDSATGGPCATPSSLNPLADPFDDAHESDQTCSNSVQVGNQCWLNGTVNYGTYGIMVSLCQNEFPKMFFFAQKLAETLIRTYKSMGPHPEDPTLPLAWFRATFNGGPAGKPPDPGNRPQCKCTCGCAGSVVAWDYVWEPVKSRDDATPPTPPSVPPPIPVAPAIKTHTVLPGESLSKIAQKFYGDPTLWPKIYQANKALIGPNPNILQAGQKLVIP